MPQIAASAAALPYSRIREIAELAMTMDGVYKLYFGESTLPTAPFIKQAAVQALHDGHTFYTSNAGTRPLRKAIAEYYQRLHGVSVAPLEQVVVTASGVQALNVAIRCVIDPGDEALVLTPSWPNGSTVVQMFNGRSTEIPQKLAGGRFTIDFDALEAAITPRTRLLIYTSPSNPLGWVATQDEQRSLLEFTRKHNLWLLADEVYERLYYDGDVAPSILRLAEPDDAVIVVQSFSKAWCMTGWRIGWLVARKDLATRAGQLNEFIITQAASFSQVAAQAALEQGDQSIREMLGMFRSNRDYCLGVLRSCSKLTVPDPEGAFYFFPRVEGLTDSFAFCKELLLETKVGIAPGVAFGAGGEGSVRICYAAERSVLEPALDRFIEFVQKR